MLLPPRFELVLVVFLNKAAMIGTVALLTPGLGQRTCCPSLNDEVSQHMHSSDSCLGSPTWNLVAFISKL